MSQTPWISATCRGERCFCGKPAAAKVGEEIAHDDPMPNRHNLTAYMCARHFAQVMGPAGEQLMQRPGPENILTAFQIRKLLSDHRRMVSALEKIAQGPSVQRLAEETLHDLHFIEDPTKGEAP